MSNQAHASMIADARDRQELIELGQLLAIYVPITAQVPATVPATYPPLALSGKCIIDL
jgi:hypothetical protein